ncbi:MULTISPECIES: type II secretion system F family protein [unclassified Oleiphilus]|jgi:MSHA biogenesis protein MshG|uniref:type II secretion system F family protein n=5 Tax=Oleiphilus TaxID=141450 RepID=UPI0007C21126|nr:MULTISPECIES: type II secretion system F family protein [unclassified Oleiphilus]KZY47050.1 MSHA biogenesis protein MshG [Oleiphilus sp. HI0050]KZY77106.1 MSHA biogenesis protein MshG [Oleiphilus sp. HI0068]KZZ28095.1 MSHA biogenesis protein MshG [Oleiphilus sp. HI0081]KZY30995.1 MSHA biogenesis protein MshG [Oleiphilus sp. HI0043]KZY60723.1 MSHA biogenesis protein MshG [Oleiphilus sp. HI0061]
MARFQYKGRDAKGAQVSGELEIASESAAANELLKKGITPVQISELQEASKSLGSINIQLIKPKVTLDELIIFCRQMNALARAGIPIIRAMKGLADSTKSEVLRETLFDVSQRLESGVNLASCMQAHPKVFSDLFISMIHVGENTGQLEEAFKRLSESLEMERDTRKRIKQATRYPTMVISAIFIALFIVNLFVIPKFASVFAKFGADLPLPTQILVATSEFCLAYWWLIIGLIFAGIYAFKQWVATENGNYIWDRKKLGFPIVGVLFEQIALSRFTRNFAMMLASGMPITHALAIAAEASGNKFIGKRIIDMKVGIERGDSLLRTARATEIFTPLVLQMMAVGEETGSIDSLLDEVADFYDEEADYSLKRLSEAIEPILIVAMGGIVLVLALGVFLPIWDLGQAAMGR